MNEEEKKPQRCFNYQCVKLAVLVDEWLNMMVLSPFSLKIERIPQDVLLPDYCRKTSLV